METNRQGEISGGCFWKTEGASKRRDRDVNHCERLELGNVAQTPVRTHIRGFPLLRASPTGDSNNPSSTPSGALSG